MTASVHGTHGALAGACRIAIVVVVTALVACAGPVPGASPAMDEAFQTRIPGTAEQPHYTITDAGHFLQEDKGEELAERLVRFIRETGG